MDLSKAKSAAPENLQLKLHRIHLKNSLFEAATLTLSLIEHPPQPTVDLQVYANVYTQEKNHEAVLTLQVTAKHQDSLLWRAQCQMAGLYTLLNFTEEQQKQTLNGFCMSQIYPYACAEVSRMVMQGGFPHVHLNPMDFGQLYQEQMKADQKNDLATKQSVNAIDSVEVPVNKHSLRIPEASIN